MAYSTAKEVREMLKDDLINILIGNSYIEEGEEKEKLITPLIEQAVLDADGEIDGYLAKRYPVPIAAVPKIINKFSKDIAIYNLFSRIGIDESSEQKNYLNRYNSAVKYLTLLAEGKVSLGADGNDGMQPSAQTDFSICSAPRLFTRSTMKGM